MGPIIPFVMFGTSMGALLAWGILAKKKAAREREEARPEKAA
jgi:surfactin synthase thioesterase subunit